MCSRIDQSRIQGQCQMVNRTSIKELLDDHFNINGQVTIAPNQIVNVDGNIRLLPFAVTQLPVKFGTVTGNFYCYNNHLENLHGAPRKVGGDFDCSKNLLETLEGAPAQVDGDFSCRDNALDSLAHAPPTVVGSFFCARNHLTNLVGAPAKVGGDFYCDHNQLESLEGAPAHVGDTFLCNDNPLRSLSGIPDHVQQGIVLTYNKHLPLLRLLNYQNTLIERVPDDQLITIIKKYEGQGKKAALACAAELIRAGFKDNARW